MKLKMTFFGGLAVFGTLLAMTSPASSQLALSCFTLKNDLANFDRRVRRTHGYLMPDLKHAHQEMKTAILPRKNAFCFDEVASDNCEAPSPVQIRRYERLKAEYQISHLGGSDPVRLRIIGEMQKLGCPLPEHVKEQLELMEGSEPADIHAKHETAGK